MDVGVVLRYMAALSAFVPLALCKTKKRMIPHWIPISRDATIVAENEFMSNGCAGQAGGRISLFSAAAAASAQRIMYNAEEDPKFS